MTEEIIRTSPQACLKCGYTLDAHGAIGAGGRGPRVGDVAICSNCSHLMEYGVGLVFVEPSDATILEMAGDPTMLKMQRAVAMVRKWKEEKKRDQE